MTQDLRDELARLESAFAALGGRGVELAERIDELRQQLAEAGPYSLRPVGMLGDGRELFLFSDGTVRTGDGVLLR